jgi:hypothetical protein
MAQATTNNANIRGSSFFILPEWVSRLFSMFLRKQASSTGRQHLTVHGEFIDEFGRVEFLSPYHGC